MGRFTHEQKYNVTASSEELQELEVGSASETTATEPEGYSARRRSPLKMAGIVAGGLALLAVLGVAAAGLGATARNGSPESSLELLSVCAEHPTKVVGESCSCGTTADCAANKYCYGRRVSGTVECEDEPLPCSISSSQPILLDCMCDAQGASPTACELTQYCYGSPPTCEDKVECVESTTTKTQDPFCKCGTLDTNTAKPYCYTAAGATAPEPQIAALECPTSFSKELEENCACGSDSPCAKGRYCYGSVAAATNQQCNAEAKACPESSTTAIAAADGPCKCGSESACAVGKYCYEDMCESNPMECPQSPDTKLKAVCRCGSTLECQEGNYCYTNQCEREPEGTVVKTSFTVDGIDYAKLVSDANVHADFQVAVREAIAKTATHETTKDEVEVTLSAGSGGVKVDATITPKPGVSAKSMESSLVAAGGSLTSNVVNEVEGVANIATATTGTVAVTDLVTPFLKEPEGATAAETPTSEPATPAPTSVEGQTIEDLEWWAEHGAKFEGAEFQQRAEEAKLKLEEMKANGEQLKE